MRTRSKPDALDVVAGLLVAASLAAVLVLLLALLGVVG
jgi:hypothetical protein